jgi:hypothetical protein
MPIGYLRNGSRTFALDTYVLVPHVLVRYLLVLHVLLVNQSFIPLGPYFPASTELTV